MRVFCEHIREIVLNRFGIEIDAFISRKRKLVHFAFRQPLLSYTFCNELLHFVRKEWKASDVFFEDNEIFFPRLRISQAKNGSVYLIVRKKRGCLLGEEKSCF